MDCSCCLVAEWCPTPCDPVDCSPPGSSVPGISQTRILQWVAISFSSRYSWPREQTCISCTGRWILSHWATKEAHDKWIVYLKKRLQCPLNIGDCDGEVEIYQNDLYMLLLAFYCLLLFIYVFIYFCFFFLSDWYGEGWGGHGNLLQYSCIENYHGQRCLVGYSPWGHKELETTELLIIAQHMVRGKGSSLRQLV